MTAEEWRRVADFPDYEVSNLGRVVSYRRYPQGREIRGRLMDGYRRVVLFSDARQRDVGIHMLVAEAFIGPRLEGLETRHLDGNPLNNHVGNLAYGTHADNMQDRLAHGRHPMASKTHCKRGHEFTEASTLVYRGGRFCRPCRKSRRLETQQAARAA